MNAFPDTQRAALTRLRVRNPGATLYIPTRQRPLTPIRVKMRWPGGRREVRRLYAVVQLDGSVMTSKRRIAR